MRKVLSVMCDILCVLAALIGAAMIVLRIFGVQFLAVRTGSMGQTYPVGSLVAVRFCDPEKIETGDVITYMLDGEADTYVTHRVVSIDTDSQTFVTQGDAADETGQSEVAFLSILGKVCFCIPCVGYPLLWFGSAGKWFFAGVLVLLAAFGLVKGRSNAKET